MRRRDKGYIMDLISTINEALDYLIETKVGDDTSLYDDCNVAIHAIVNKIREVLDDESIMKYNDLLNNLVIVGEEISSRNLSNGYTILSELLFRIEKEEAHYEVVFLPYKASMWDSLESIWKAVSEDSNCICHVIPIPYYDKDKEGKFGDYHYEGNQFPDYVPITQYEEYDLAIQRPDIIYFHNPYDKFNKLTSVDPNFYSEQLKAYCSCLVYVPYFLVMESLPEDFTILPALFHADFVMVQSDEIANVYKKNYVGNDIDKFIPLGSPKVDGILNRNRNENEILDIPKEWIDKIDNKTVLLYNTHISNAMSGGQELIEKITSTIQYLDKQQDVVLLWRPHPLSISTMSRMNTKVLDCYYKLIEEFKKKDNTIYDDSSNLQRALLISHGYYGDISSLVPMYEAMKKPILIQNMNIIGANNHGKAKLSFTSCIQDGDRIWFSADECNGLFCFDTIREENVYIGEFLGEGNDMYLYSDIVRYQNKLVCIPRSATSIGVYDMETSEFSSIVLEECKTGQSNKKFMQGIMYDNYIYMIPGTCEYILRMNMISGEMEYNKDWIELITSDYRNEKDIYFRYDRYIDGHTAWIPSCSASIILELNLKSFQVKIHDLSKTKLDIRRTYHHITYHKGYYYLLPRQHGAIVRVSIMDGEIIEWKEYSRYPKKFKSGTYPFAFAKVIEDRFYIFPLQGNMTLELDIDSGKILESDFFAKSKDGLQYHSNPWKENEKSPYIYSNSAYQFICVENKEKKVIPMSYPNEWDHLDSRSLRSKKVVSESILFENNITSLKRYIELVRDNRKEEWKPESMVYDSIKDSVGMKIHEFVMGAI